MQYSFPVLRSAQRTMGPFASSSPAPAPARVDERLQLELPDGRRTTVHIARWDRARTRLRIERLATQQRVVDWCAQSGCADALVGGFYTRPAGLPLGELRLSGRRVPHVPFTVPWDATRASLLVGTRPGAVRIDRRDALPAAPAGDLLQAGPLLVRGGRVACRDGVDAEGFSAAAEQFDSDITAGRHPRAALGVGRHELIALVADGRSPQDAGLTLGRARGGDGRHRGTVGHEPRRRRLR